MDTVPSVLAPSTTMYSISGWVCPRTLRMVSRKVEALLKQTVMMEIFMKRAVSRFPCRIRLSEAELVDHDGVVGVRPPEIEVFLLEFPRQFPAFLPVESA